MDMAFRSLEHQNNSLYEILKLKENFQTNKVITGKNPFFVIGLFCTILFVLALASDMTVLYGNAALSILVLSTKKRYSNFLKKISFSRKFVAKLKY